ncbi:MAG TPA: hypothetical protein VJZ32_10520 [Candidatus Bathyarchaeia archaeon]|nr:hypothetical protein [Candidatus Bathyarchaeia archaeon]HKM77659.1 hypothetical protein [Candidatus Bathyarchaeia archaeon]
MPTSDLRNTERRTREHDVSHAMWILVGLNGRTMGFSRSLPNWGANHSSLTQTQEQDRWVDDGGSTIAQDRTRRRIISAKCGEKYG